MCEINYFEKLQAVPVMLNDDALEILAENQDWCKTFDEAL